MHFLELNDDFVIFHLDDDEDTLELFSRIVENGLEGAKVKSFSRANELLEQLAKPQMNEKPLLIVLDIKMPDITGDEAHDLIESYYFSHGLRPPPTLFFTGATPNDLSKKRGHMGLWPNGWNVLEKPATSEVIIREIKRITNR